ncbi:mediator of RNA polymerase II transcription subunit 12-like isoform X1 [Cucumis melo var. makuwa]|uniref:Mediator of RNA polymerase II transcription subunit 12-like isoform X1 n=1 Tax=Cucumis melo var. makuwa TaxID=1194695 RepID=A0A5A7SSA4_CUCMM|nr:mediator of RNA polymerase II transcription subunit 12-like isoform X1 [Cucumis melo var. makuwa]TYK21583.1 mediator of RNA polymerase II transcription subunit 12-like isoform X1 [Cucumis melo var. makuwa]
MRLSIRQFDVDVTEEYIDCYKNITRLYITRPGVVMGHLRSNNSRLRDVADDPQHVLNICNDNERQEYHDLGIDPSSSYMHGHGHGCGEQNGYLYYEVPAAILEQLDEQ